MTKTIEAVFENGVLRPLTPVDLQEQQRVLLTVQSGAEGEELLDVEYMREMAALAEPDISLEEVQQTLAKIAGSMAEFIQAEREDRL